MSAFSTGLKDECTSVSSRSSTRVFLPCSLGRCGPSKNCVAKFRLLLSLCCTAFVLDCPAVVPLFFNWHLKLIQLRVEKRLLSYGGSYLHLGCICALWNLANKLTELIAIDFTLALIIVLFSLWLLLDLSWVLTALLPRVRSFGGLIMTAQASTGTFPSRFFTASGLVWLHFFLVVCCRVIRIWTASVVSCGLCHWERLADFFAVAVLSCLDYRVV